MIKDKGNPGNVIRNYRNAKGMTLNEMRKIVGVSLQQYQKYEAWISQPPFNKLEIIVNTLEIPPVKLFNVGKISDFSEQFEKKIKRYAKIIKLLESEPKLLKMIKAYGKGK